jgi:hypothetical protein
MDKTLIFGLFGHFYTDVNPKMISNLSRGAPRSEGLSCLGGPPSLKIESFNLKTFFKK